ncbi:hypothetical protein WDW37_16605 [Bdellovibrionota bacterium FG-1]
MKRKNTRYYAFRLKVEKMKLKSWRLYVFAKILVFLLQLLADCLRQT